MLNVWSIDGSNIYMYPSKGSAVRRCFIHFLSHIGKHQGSSPRIEVLWHWEAHGSWEGLPRRRWNETSSVAQLGTIRKGVRKSMTILGWVHRKIPMDSRLHHHNNTEKNTGYRWKVSAMFNSLQSWCLVCQQELHPDIVLIYDELFRLISKCMSTFHLTLSVSAIWFGDNLDMQSDFSKKLTRNNNNENNNNKPLWRFFQKITTIAIAWKWKIHHTVPLGCPVGS